MSPTEFEPLLAAAVRLERSEPEAPLFEWADEQGRIVERVTRRDRKSVV